MNEAKDPARERELDKTTSLYNAATDYAAYVNSNKHDYDESMKLSDALEAAAVAYAELAGDRQPVMTQTPAISTLASSNGSVAQLPPLEGDLKEILGKTCLTVAGLGRRLHDLNLYAVPRRVEEEQAAALHWMLNLYLAHGQEWRSVGEKILKAEAPQNDELTHRASKP